MAIISRIANKTKFETGDVPTQNDFIDLLDSVFHFGSDTLDNVSQGTNRKWLTPTQIATFNSKANGTHGHAISEITALASTLASKMNLVDPKFLTDVEIESMGQLAMSEFTNLFGSIPKVGLILESGSYPEGFPASEWTLVFDNDSGIQVDAKINFQYINMKNGAVDYSTINGSTLQIAVNHRLIVKGSFIANPNGTGLVFVGIIDIKQK